MDLLRNASANRSFQVMGLAEGDSVEWVGACPEGSSVLLAISSGRVVHFRADGQLRSMGRAAAGVKVGPLSATAAAAGCDRCRCCAPTFVWLMVNWSVVQSPTHCWGCAVFPLMELT